MTYIADSIGTKYEQWKGGDVVFISSPTGSGKTTFIFNVFLRFLANKGQKILYLVNRTVLKEQLQEERSSLPYDLKKCIDIELYQNIERKLLRLKFDGTFLNRDYRKISEYLNYDCVVCDEAHYFMMDSNYNTNTILSYKFVDDCFKDKIRIYMSATIDKIKECITRDCIEGKKNIQSTWLNYQIDATTRRHLMLGGKEHAYDLHKKYENIEIGILKTRDEIKNLVVNENGKWLIFVDSKIFGQTLESDINDIFENEKPAVFVTSGYGSDDEKAEVVGTIVTEGRQAPKILITTSVLDNGINIKDIELRNVIIVADTETEFIQMLGRKRTDGMPVKVYIYKHDRNHFNKRKCLNTRRLELADSYYSSIKKIMKNYTESPNMVKSQDSVNCFEKQTICTQHQILMSKLMDNKVKYDDIRTLFLSFDGFFVLNMLSFENLKNLDKYYVELLKKFDKYGEDAFLREQLLWLEKTDEEIEKLLSDAYQDKYELSKTRVINALDSSCNKTMSKEEFSALKNTIKNDLEELVEHVGKEHSDYQKYLDLCKKNDRGISSKFMEYLKDNCGIPYVVEPENGNYTVKKASE